MKKKILYIHHGSIKGGAPLSLLSLIQHMNNDKYECIICSSENNKDVDNYFKSYGFTTCRSKIPKFAHTTGGYFNLKGFRGWFLFYNWIKTFSKSKEVLKDLLKKIKPDLVHFNSLTLAPYVVVPFKLGIPNIVHVRESVLKGVIGLRRAWLKYCLDRYADQVIFICKDNMERLSLRGNKTSIIYNPVDFEKFNHNISQAENRRALEIDSDAKAVLFASGSVIEEKGIRQFLEAMGKIIEKEPNLTCLMPSIQFPADPKSRKWTIKRRIGKIAGIYKKSDDFFKLTRKNDLYRHIISANFTQEIEKWIAAADVVCVPHIRPHFSRMIMEAGAMKKPVVAFRIGGIEEVVRDGETGLLVPLGDVQSLAKETEKLLYNPNMRRQLGENGYAQALELFEANKHARNVEHIYERLFS